MFRRLISDREKKLKKTLKNSQIKLKLFKEKTKRKNVTFTEKIQILLDTIKKIKIMSNSSYYIVSIVRYYIVSLHSIQRQLTFKLKNKLSAQCINWHQNKMKVKYAVHTFNASSKCHGIFKK